MTKSVLDYQLTSPGFDRVVIWALAVTSAAGMIQCVYREDWLMVAILGMSATSAMKALLPHRARL